MPVIESFMAAHDLPDVTVVADADMVSEANQKAIEAAGLSFILVTGPAARCAASTSRSPRPSRPSPGRPR